MKKIAITVPELFDGEAATITSLLLAGDFWRVHIRKPDASDAQVAELLKAIPQELYPRLTMHYHFDVARQFALGGVHLNSRCPEPPEGWSGKISCSFHSIDELTSSSSPYDYAFLSPIYPSISKPGYKGDFNFDQLRGAVNEKIFALGGVTPEKFDEIKSIGFGGVAMLGSVWKAYISSKKFQLQYITHAQDITELMNQVDYALRGGCGWIQLRHKGADTDTLIREGREIRRLCDAYNATFIIDDHVELVDAVGADGVHLGKNDMPVAQARKILGIRKIIGATANTFDDIVVARDAGADYVGLGPYRFTTTKEKLSPVLGISGYGDILNRCRAENVDLPIVAIGGIDFADIASIMSTGVAGIAVSGTIRNAENPQLATAQILQLIQQSITN